VPTENHLLVERLGAAGRDHLGKTNTPEFGRRQPNVQRRIRPDPQSIRFVQDLRRLSAAPAVTVACGMLPFADAAMSRRACANPGASATWSAFVRRSAACRHGPCRTPGSAQRARPDRPHGRRCRVLYLATMAGPDRAHRARPPNRQRLYAAAYAQVPQERVAWSRDLGGLPMDSRVSDVLEAQRSVFNRLGCIVEEAEPDLAPATEAFHTLRALAFVQRYGPLLKEKRAQLKGTIVWNAEQG